MNKEKRVDTLEEFMDRVRSLPSQEPYEVAPAEAPASSCKSSLQCLLMHSPDALLSDTVSVRRDSALLPKHLSKRCWLCWLTVIFMQQSV